MKAEINNENKAKFFAQYWEQHVMRDNTTERIFPVYDSNIKFDINDAWLQLKPLSSISDDDAIEVARLAYQLPKSHFEIVRRCKDGLIHLENYSENDIGLTKHVSINKYGCINTNWHFTADEKNKAQSFKINIGDFQDSCSKLIPYIAIVDYFRSKGYALHWMGLSVDEMVEAGWVKLVEK